MMGVVHQDHVCQGYKEVHCGLRSQTTWKSLYISHQPDYRNRRPWKEPMLDNRNGEITYVYRIVPNWQRTLTSFLIPLCNYIKIQEEKIKNENIGTKYAFNDLFSTCQIQNKYKNNRREGSQSVINDILPTCSVLINYRSIHGSNFTLAEFSPTCEFLLGYRDNTKRIYPGNVLNVDNFDPLCTYAFKYHEDDTHDHHDPQPQEPDSFCIEYSDEK
ncbi:uncharacterized protein LOC132938888 [Metopolophium dirhodum]|uniref:uncharacterized protein LOC132938888 n=1 Tax=Metopolophium dirhodum TaxID=44670 RepID=UPI00298F4A59|nr:uncharacterized protein LOC132938888 [Metopolophium dirhodum]